MKTANIPVSEELTTLSSLHMALPFSRPSTWVYISLSPFAPNTRMFTRPLLSQTEIREGHVAIVVGTEWQMIIQSGRLYLKKTQKVTGILKEYLMSLTDRGCYIAL